MSENVLDWLQKWYQSQCDGDWEHEYGIQIDTVDNPGWYVVIDLVGTECENQSFSPVRLDQGNNNWYFCLVRDNKFEASGGPNYLIKILEIFRSWVNECSSSNKQGM